MARLRFIWAVITFLTLLGFSRNIGAQQRFTPTDFGQTSVGSSSASTTVSLSFANPSGRQALVSIRYGLEFTTGAASCNAGYTSCSLPVTFSPQHPGLRQDSIIVTDSTGAVLGTMLIHGIGSGPQVTISPGLAAEVNVLSRTASAITLNSANELYVADQLANAVYKVQPDTATYVVVAGQEYTVGYAGDGSAAASATLSSPGGLAVDGAGNVFIADSGNNVVRRVNSATGNITTILGGAATGVQLRNPRGLVLDSSGNLYVADTGNNMIRRLNAADGSVTTVAGTGSRGYSGDSGPAINATLNDPKGIAIDDSGNLFIADSSNNVVRKVDTAGAISTYAGNGIAASYGTTPGDGGSSILAGLNQPNSVAVDASGSVYIADSNFVRRVDSGTQLIFTVAGSGPGSYFYPPGSGPATSLQIAPTSLVLDPTGSLFIGATSRIIKINEPAGSLILPRTPAGSTSSSAISRVLNSGNSVLHFSGLTVTSGFTQRSSGGTDCASSTVLSAGTACQLAIAAAPTADNSPLGTVSLFDDALNRQGTQQIALSATGPGEQQLTASPSALNFGNVALGTTSAPLAITISNPGNLPATTGDIGLNSNASSGFQITNFCGAQVPAHSSCQVSVTFTPQQDINANAQLVIKNYAPSSPATIYLYGFGVPSYTIAASPLNFSSRKILTTSAPQTFTITNTSPVPVTRPALYIYGANSSEFSYSTAQCPATLASGAVCTVSVSFTPSGNGARVATLEIYDRSINPEDQLHSAELDSEDRRESKLTRPLRKQLL